MYGENGCEYVLFLCCDHKRRVSFNPVWGGGGSPLTFGQIDASIFNLGGGGGGHGAPQPSVHL